MLQLLRTITVACVTASFLAACGGAPKSSVTPPLSTNAKGRAVRSIPCTPDSYGYCSVQTYRNITLVRCDRYHAYTSGVIDYEVYNATTDLGQYEQTWYGNCLDYDSGFNWDPNDPAMYFGDPNLP